MSENWVVDNVYCVKCGCELKHFENNKPVGDMYCEKCKEEFELKSNKTKLGKKIVDGAYSTMIEKIDNGEIPNFFYLNYSLQDYKVNNLIVIPKHYFTKEIIIERPPLPQTARRAGWVGCNIDVSSIPESGKVSKGYLLETPSIWGNIHPMLISIPVDWDYKLKFGIIYPKKPNKAIKTFLNEIEKLN